MRTHMLVWATKPAPDLKAMPKTPTIPNTKHVVEPDARRQLKGTSIELPAYVWEQVRVYLDEHPEQRIRHMVMAGFQALGLQIDPEDLVAERRRGPAG